MLSPKNQPTENQSRTKHTQTVHPYKHTHIHNFFCIIFLQNPQCASPTNLTVDIRYVSLIILPFQNGNILKVVLRIVLNLF